jgi:hypothetical protein
VLEDQLASPDYFFLDGASFLDEAVDGIIYNSLDFFLSALPESRYMAYESCRYSAMRTQYVLLRKTMPGVMHARIDRNLGKHILTASE